jgi:chromosome segregation and condensation protein ScpB
VASDTSPEHSTLSDKALAVFAFALYHQLESGEPVSRVVLSDGAGHRADAEAVDALQRAGLAAVDGNWIVFTEEGVRRVSALADAARSAAASPPR